MSIPEITRLMLFAGYTILYVSREDLSVFHRFLFDIYSLATCIYWVWCIAKGGE